MCGASHMQCSIWRIIPLGALILGVGTSLSAPAAGGTDPAQWIIQNHGSWVLGRSKPPAQKEEIVLIGADPEVNAGPGQEIYTCKVHVADEATGAPIGGAVVTVALGGEISAPPGRATTDAKGDFLIRRLRRKAASDNAEN